MTHCIISIFAFKSLSKMEIIGTKGNIKYSESLFANRMIPEDNQIQTHPSIFAKILIGIISFLLYVSAFFVFEVLHIGNDIVNPKSLVDGIGIVVGTIAAYGIMRVDKNSRLPLGLVFLILAMIITGTADFILQTVNPNLEGINPWQDSFRVSSVLFVILIGSLIGKKSPPPRKG